jgi:hypothetical protein
MRSPVKSAMATGSRLAPAPVISTVSWAFASSGATARPAATSKALNFIG